MATYNNPHWLLSHIRNSFISTDDTGLCETVMVSDDLPKQFLQKLNTQKKMNSCTNKDLQITTTTNTTTTTKTTSSTITKTTTTLPLNTISGNDITTQLLLSSYYEDDLYCYPGLDQSDDEDLDLASQSFDIPMYPEIGAHRYRSNTAQKLEKMEIARRKAAHIKNIKIDDSTVINKDDKNNDDILNRLFVRKKIKSNIITNISNNINNHDNHNGNKNSYNKISNDNFINNTNNLEETIQQTEQQYLQEGQQPHIQQEEQQPHIQKEEEQQQQIQQDQKQIVSMANHRIKKNISSRLVEQLLSCPKKPQNRFIQYARFDGTTQTGIPTKNLNIFLSMLPENQRNYPMKICVTATAKIQEVIGFICYKCNIINPEIQLQSVRHYGLYISEDNGEMDMDFPPLDLREPCSKFGFTCLTLAELRPTAHITRVDYRSLSMTSEIEAAGEAAIADVQGLTGQTQSDDMAKMLGHNSMIEAPLYRTFRIYMIMKGIFKAEVQLGISGEKLEIDPVQNKNTKFWSRQKAMSYNIESIAYCEIVAQKSNRSILRIWYLTVRPHGIISGNTSGNIFYPDSPYGHHNQTSNLLLKTSNKQSDLLSGNIVGCSSSSPQHTTNFATNIHNFKYYDFETDFLTAQQIVNKLNFLLEVRSSVTRREFLIAREKKKEKNSSRKLLIK